MRETDTAHLDKSKKRQVIGQQYRVGKTVGEVMHSLCLSRSRDWVWQGAFAKVKYAEHILTKEPVAIKVKNNR